MKKTYIAPALNIVRVQTQHMIAGSLGTMSDNGDVVTVSGNELGEGVEAEGRGGSIWDDEY